MLQISQYIESISHFFAGKSKLQSSTVENFTKLQIYIPPSYIIYLHNILQFTFYILFVLQYVPRKGFGLAVCAKRDRYIVYIVSQTADPNHFQGTHCMVAHLLFKA